MIYVHTIVNSILNSCTYILYNDSEDVYLIDCGETESILNYLRKNNKAVKGIFLTHCHYDHIYGINEIIRMFPEVVVYASKETIVGLKDPKINLSKYHGDTLVVSAAAKVYEISESSDIQTFNCYMKIMETPGHDVGCLSFQISNFLFTGDSYIPNLPVFTKWKRSDKKLAFSFEQKLKDLKESQNLILHPGHLIYD